MQFLDPNAVISEAKLTQYLLVLLSKDDKSQFLALAGYTLENWQRLERDMKKQILSLEATSTQNTSYGQKYAIRGTLTGPNGVSLSVRTIWIVIGGITRFVTLFPDYEKSTMKFPLFAQVALCEDLPEYGLHQGAVGVIVEYYPMSEGQEDGYSIEGLISKDTVEVSESQIKLIAVPIEAP